MKQPISRQLVQRLEVEIDKAVDLMPDDAVEREDIQVAMSVFVAAGSELVRLAQVEILRDAIARDQASIQEARAQIERLQAEAIR